MIGQAISTTIQAVALSVSAGVSACADGAILQKHINTGERDIDDVGLATRRFQELIKAGFFNTAVFGIRNDFTQHVD